MIPKSGCRFSGKIMRATLKMVARFKRARGMNVLHPMG
jgi:hypothetical protein